MVGGEGGWERREVGDWARGEKNREEEECIKIRIEEDVLTCRWSKKNDNV